MKKVTILSSVLLLALCFASCDLKKCYCYDNGGREYEDHVYSDERCSKLTSGDYGCVEVNERLTADQRNALAEDKHRKSADNTFLLAD